MAETVVSQVVPGLQVSRCKTVFSASSLPVKKKVARTPASASMPRMLSVAPGVGPSSKVSARTRSLVSTRSTMVPNSWKLREPANAQVEINPTATTVRPRPVPTAHRSVLPLKPPPALCSVQRLPLMRLGRGSGCVEPK